MKVSARWSQEIDVQNDVDENDNPTGGHVRGTGLSIDWQNGPLGRGDDRKEPNGAWVQEALLACIERMKFYQSSKFACRENALALTHMQEAMHWLQHRHDERELREVQGTHSV